MKALLFGSILLLAATMACGGGPRLTPELFTPTIEPTKTSPAPTATAMVEPTAEPTTPTPVPPRDDGNDISSATPISTNTSVVGVIDPAGDADFFSFDATLGTAYVLEIFLSSLEESRLVLFDSNERRVNLNTGGTAGDPSGIRWIALESGTHYISIRGADDSQTGSYSLSVSMVR